MATYRRKLASTKARQAREQALLDVGCGTGSLALELASYVAHAHAMDVSTEMLRVAEGKAEYQGVRKTTCHIGTLDQPPPFPLGSFDGGAYDILHLVGHRQQVLQQLFEQLKSGGYFISSTVCLGDSCVPYRPMLAVMRWLGKAPRVHIVSRGQLVREMAEVGFVEIAGHEVGASATTAFVVAAKLGWRPGRIPAADGRAIGMSAYRASVGRCNWWRIGGGCWKTGRRKATRGERRLEHRGAPRSRSGIGLQRAQER